MKGQRSPLHARPEPVPPSVEQSQKSNSRRSCQTRRRHFSEALFVLATRIVTAPTLNPNSWLSPPRDGRPSASLPSSIRAAKPKAAGSLPLHLLGRRERAARYLVPLTCFFSLGSLECHPSVLAGFADGHTPPSPFRGGEHPHQEWNGGKKITESGPRKLDACVLRTHHQTQ